MSLVSRVRERLLDSRTGARPGRATEFAKTMIVVVPLTALIWIYAERAQVGPDKVSLLLTAATAEPNLVADMIDPVEQPITINLNGPRGQIEALKQRLDGLLDDGRYKLTLSGVDAAVGPHVIDATQVLNRDPMFVNSGVTVTGTTPQQIRVVVDPLVSREADVVLPRDVPVELLNHSFEPATVTLTGPQPAFPPGRPTVTADVSGLTARDDTGAQSVDIALLPPADRRLKMSTTKVKITFTAGSSVTRDKVPTVFIDVVRPIGDEDGKSKVIVTSGNVVHNVWLRGPTSLVSKYTGAQPTESLRGLLYVSREDVGKGSLTGELQWRPIEGGQVVVEGGPYTVTYEVRED